MTVSVFSGFMEKCLKEESCDKKNKKDNLAKHEYLKRFMALAFLPSGMIKDAFQFLVEDCRRAHGAYFDNYPWRKKSFD